MVKFGHKITRQQVTEWRKMYCHYDRLKSLLRPIIQKSNFEQRYQDKSLCLSNLPPDLLTSPPLSSPAISDLATFPFDPHFDFEQSALHTFPKFRMEVLEAEKEFFREFGQQFSKAHTFYSEKLANFEEKINLLATELRAIAEIKSSRSFRELRNCAREIYRALKLLENFRELNATAFVKILKKHDKFSDWKESRNFFLPFLRKSLLYRSDLLRAMYSKVEEIYICYYGDGQRKKGKKKLYREKDKSSNGRNFSTGFLIGVSMGLLFLLIYFINKSTSWVKKSLFVEISLPIFRGIFLLSLHVIFWGIDKLILRHLQVNYDFIMEVAPKTKLSPIQTIFFGASLMFCCLFFFSVPFVVPITVETFWSHAHVVSVSFFMVSVIVTLCPFRYLHHNARFFVFKLLLRVLQMPFLSLTIRFSDFFLMDQLTSLQRVFYDVNYSLCLFFSGSFTFTAGEKITMNCREYQKVSNWVIAVIPFSVRAFQCFLRYRETRAFFPHVVNALKYISADVFSLTAMAYLYFPGKTSLVIYIVCACISTIYSFAWDIMVDWGLLQRNSANFLLREKILLPVGVYWGAMVANLLLRVTWLASISPIVLGVDVLNNGFVVLLLATLEVFRRCLWNIFRFENEHLNNVGQFRATDIIPLGVTVLR